MADRQDRIEREIDIDAPAQTVFALVSEPGWWINEGTVVPHRLEIEGDITIVHDDVHGEFRLRTVRVDPPRYAAFRWLDREQPTDGEQATLVEFFVKDRNEGVTLRVVESGFSLLAVPEPELVTRIADNAEGWETELAAARKHLA